MAEIVLHHYWLSPYAEKIRRILGFKGLTWRSVLIPIVAPKPDLTALTGGYRKTPVMQIGADIYCDTDCIARVIDGLHPEPPLFADHAEGLSYMLGPWQQELFMVAVQTVGTSANVFPEGFVEDRSTMFEGGFDLEKLLAEAPARRDQLRAKLHLLERHLGDGRAFLGGRRASLADFCIFHPLFALKNVPETASLLDPFPSISGWMGRMDEFGHGKLIDTESAEAIEIARQATPITREDVDVNDPNGRKPGDRVRVVHDSFGRDPSVGELVASSVDEIAIRHHDERAGEVVVHFPREHYLVLPE